MAKIGKVAQCHTVIWLGELCFDHISLDPKVHFISTASQEYFYENPGSQDNFGENIFCFLFFTTPIMADGHSNYFVIIRDHSYEIQILAVMLSLWVANSLTCTWEGTKAISSVMLCLH